VKAVKFPSDLDACYEEIASLTCDVENLKLEISQLKEEIDGLNDELAEANLDRDYQEGQILDLHKELDNAYRDDRFDNEESGVPYDPAED
jgi:chromosome segregation ATPase